MDGFRPNPDFSDDFNYPSLNRKDLMILDTIKEKDFKRKGINRLISNRDWSMGLYNLDIDKSFPKRRDRYLNKIDFINKIDDIEKARPSKEKKYNKPNFSLNVRDIEKAYPKKERQFHGKNYDKNNIGNINNNNKNNYTPNKVYQRPIYENGRYGNNEINKNNEFYYKRNIFDFMKDKDQNFQRNNYSSLKSQNLTKSLDTLKVLQSQKNYKDTIHDIFNHYPKYPNIPENKEFYYLNHNHDLFQGIPNKDNRLDMIMDKSNKYLSYDFSEKLNYLENNKKNIKNIMIKPNSVRINKQIPVEFKNQGLEKLYRELDSYKPRTYEQNMDLFTQNY